MAGISQAPDPGEMSAEDFARLVNAWGEDTIITEGIRAAGTERVLDRMFDEMAARFRGGKAGNVDADVQWSIEIRGEVHHYALHMRAGNCEARKGEVEDPRVAFRTDLGAFARLVTGQANPVALVVTRRLKVRGDLLFARRVPGFFRMPRG